MKVVLFPEANLSAQLFPSIKTKTNEDPYMQLYYLSVFYNWKHFRAKQFLMKTRNKNNLHMDGTTFYKTLFTDAILFVPFNYRIERGNHLIPQVMPV